MSTRLSDLRYKEVINVISGQRLGFVSDAEMDCTDGRIIALIVPGPARFFGLLGREDDYVLPWECISRLGDDIILIDVKGELPRCRKEKRGW